MSPSNSCLWNLSLKFAQCNNTFSGWNCAPPICLYLEPPCLCCTVLLSFWTNKPRHGVACAKLRTAAAATAGRMKAWNPRKVHLQSQRKTWTRHTCSVYCFDNCLPKKENKSKLRDTWSAAYWRKLFVSADWICLGRSRGWTTMGLQCPSIHCPKSKFPPCFWFAKYQLTNKVFI